MRAMTETTSRSKKAAPVAALFELPKFDMPKFELPMFDLPNIEVPAAFREIAEQGVAQAKDAYAKLKAASEEATSLIEDTYATAAKGAAEYNRKVIEAARANANAAFDYAIALIEVKSPGEIVALSAEHVREQFGVLSEQTKELGGLVQKLASETAEPIKSGVTKAFKNVA
jgi:phasin